MTKAEKILENCKKYFIETLPYNTDTAILLEDAIEIVDKDLKEKESNILKELEERVKESNKNIVAYTSKEDALFGDGKIFGLEEAIEIVMECFA